MSFRIDQALERINGELLLLEFGTHPLDLYEPIHYTLGLGGKRLRPMLALLTCSLYDKDYEKALMPALGIEVFHNFSLIHDDIMDQASIRRGQPTVHERWGTPTAILSGDVALVEAYQLILQVPEALKWKAFELFSLMAKGVCEGQQLDMQFEKENIVSTGEYIQMIRLKTAVLLGFSMQLGALIGGASDEEANKLRLFGEEIGLAFQVKDDFLDAFGDAAKVGKQIGGDIAANKKTFLFVKALELAEESDAQLLLGAYSEKSLDSAAKIERVIKLYERLHLLEETEKEIERLYQNAIKQLAGLSPGIFETAKLKRFAEQLMGRDK